jgi:5-methylcytosine-specific restriction endonuclease McrA
MSRKRKSRTRKRTYERIGVYDIKEVLDHRFTYKERARLRTEGCISKEDLKKTESHTFQTMIGPVQVRMTSQRYQLFSLKGIKCVKCGVVGKFFALEKMRSQDTKRYHFNLYGYVNGEERMLTKDHIVPKSKGGANSLSNYQVMCCKCNTEKGNKEE